MFYQAKHIVYPRSILDKGSSNHGSLSGLVLPVFVLVDCHGKNREQRVVFHPLFRFGFFIHCRGLRSVVSQLFQQGISAGSILLGSVIPCS